MRAVLREFSSYKGESSHFWIYGAGDFDPRIDDIASIVSKIARENDGVDMVYLDFLQDLSGPVGQKLEERQIIAYNAKGFKRICVDNDCAGTMLSQFNQESHHQKMPTKRSFRGSGVIADCSHLMSCLYCENNEGMNKKDVRELLFYSVKTRLVKPWGRKVMFYGKRGRFAFPSRIADEDVPDYDKQFSAK